MPGLLTIPLPWYVVGLLMGAIVAGFYAVTNKHLGISGAYAQGVNRARGRPIEVWRLRFLAGTFLGAAVVAMIGGYPRAGLGYGTLGEYLSLPALVVTLFAGGLLIGFGARWAGACTSGHGLTGCATRSRGSMVAVAIFVVTAVVVTRFLHWLTGAGYEPPASDVCAVRRGVRGSVRGGRVQPVRHDPPVAVPGEPDAVPEDGLGRDDGNGDAVGA